jgi:methenyltetrahydrofolate cyclohydrolase
MTDYLSTSIEDYLEVSASGSATPGGGSISALTGALGAAMASMSANFTIGKKKFAGVEEEVKNLLEVLSKARRRLTDLTQKDTTAYSAVSEAFRLPRETSAEKGTRKEAIAAACMGAMAVPLEAARCCREGLVATRRLADIANPNLITDVGVAALLLRAAAEGSALNVRINLSSIGNPETAENVSTELKSILEECARLSSESMEKVNFSIS